MHDLNLMAIEVEEMAQMEPDVSVWRQDRIAE